MSSPSSAAVHAIVTTTGSSSPPPPPPPDTTAEPKSFFAKLLSMLMTLGGLIPAPAAPVATTVPTLGTGASGGAAGGAVGTPSKLSSFFGGCFGFGGSGQGDASSSASSTQAPLLPLTSRGNGGQTPFRATLINFLSRFFRIGGGTTTPTAPPPAQTSTAAAPSPSRFARLLAWISSHAPDAEAWRDFFSVSREGIEWLVGNLFRFVPAKLFAVSVASSTLVLLRAFEPQPPSSSSIPLQPASGDDPSFLFPTYFILFLLMYCALNSSAKLFINGKIRFVVELGGLVSGLAALYFLVDSIHKLQVTFVFVSVAGVVVVVLLALKIWDLYLNRLV